MPKEGMVWDCAHRACFFQRRFEKARHIGSRMRNSIVLLKRKLVTESALCALALVAIPLLLHGRALISGGVPLDLSAALFQAPWQEARPMGLLPEDNPFTEWHALRYYPWFRFMNDAMARGESLQWNPFEGFGAPFFALWQSRVLSPFSLPILFLPLHLGITLSIILKLAVAGWAAFYTARRFGLPGNLALAVGVAYQLSGPIFLRMADPVGDVMPWFPLLLLNLERLILGELRVWPVGATLVGLMALGGGHNAFVGVALFALFYLLARCGRDWRGFYLHHALSGLAAIWVAGFGLAAVQILPYLEFRAQGTVQEAGLGMVSWHDLIALVAPPLLDPARLEAAPRVYLLYPGVATIYLLALWWALRANLPKTTRRRGETLLVASAALGCIPFMAATFFPESWVAWLPAPDAFFMPHGFALILVAASATQQWLNLNAEQCRSVLPRLFIAVPTLWGSLLALMLYALIRRGVPWETMLRHMSVPVLSAVGVALLLMVTLLRPKAPIMAAGLCLLSAVTQVWTFKDALAYTPPQQVLPDTNFISSLRNLEMRIGGSSGLAGWPLSGNGIAQVYNPSGVTLNRYADFANRLKEDPILLRRTGARGLLLTREDIQGAFASIRPALHIKTVYPSGAVLFEELGAESRARIIHSGRKVETLDPSLIRSNGPPLVEGVYLPEEAPKGAVSKATLNTPETYRRISVQLENQRAGVLVLADAWYPGWVARIDNQEQPVRPVDGIFRGVELKENAQQAVFEYMPKPYRFGLALSALAALVLLAGYVRLLLTLGQPWKALF